MIKIENLSKGYKTKKSSRAVIALSNINLEFNDRGVVFLLGKSGSGKTTLLNLIGGLDKAEKGIIYFKDRRIDSSEKQLDGYRNLNVGFIFQDYNLLEKETVAKNIELATSLQSIKSPKLSVEEVLSKVELSGYEKRFPNELSGGQKQRVAIARALIKNSSVILADEISNDAVYCTDYQIDEMVRNEMVFSADGINYEEFERGTDYSVLRGKYIKKEEVWPFTPVYKLAGIVKTDKDIFYDKYGRPYEKMQPPYTHQELFKKTMSFNLESLYRNIYCNQEYYASTLHEIGYNSRDYEIKLHGDIEIESLTLKSLKSNSAENYILTSSCAKYFGDMNLQNNEAVVSTDVYNKLFQTQLIFDEYIELDKATNHYIAKRIPEKLGENLQLTIKRNTIDSFIFNNESIKIVGIQMKDPANGNFASIDHTIYANAELFKIGAMNSNKNLTTIVNVPKDVKEVLKMLTSLRDDYNVVAYLPYSDVIYKYEEENIKVVATLYSISIVSMIITVLVAISLISLGITSQKKEIGILRALGASKKDTFKIYLFEGLILSTVIFIISLILTIVSVAYENMMQSLYTMQGMVFLSIQPLAYVILTIASFVLILAAVAIPLGKLSSMKPVDCIRQN